MSPLKKVAKPKENTLRPQVSYGFAPRLSLQECIRRLAAQRTIQGIHLPSVRLSDGREEENLWP